MKRFYARYTPEMVANICGCSAEDFTRVAELITSTYTPDRVGTIMYALGWTHHSHSVQLIHAAAMLQLLLGNIGRPGGGLNALRGHANIQGGTDCGMAYHNLPGYIPIPKADHESLDAFLKAATPMPLRPQFDELLVEHRSVRRQPVQGVLRQRRDAGPTTSPTTSIRSCRSRRPAATRTGAGRTSSTTCTAARWKGSSASA